MRLTPQNGSENHQPVGLLGSGRFRIWIVLTSAILCLGDWVRVAGQMVAMVLWQSCGLNKLCS